MSGDKYSIHLLLVLFLALVFLLQKSTKADVLVQCKESERQALLDFKQSLAAESVMDFGISSWGSENDERDCCTWIGVECCNNTGHVIKLDLSYLIGSVKGTQIQLFDPSTFSHNHGLCGPPVTPNCSGSAETPQGQPRRGQDDFDEFRKWFYAGMGIGFIVGFWGICGALLFKRSWRHSYFRFLDNMKDWLYVRFVLQKARLERRIRT